MPDTHPPAPDDVLDELQAQLDRYDPERFPVQHATARFHLGTVLLQRGAVDDAVVALRRAAELFPADGLPVEHGKATNMLGVALRERGETAAAAEAFARAAELLDAPGSRLEAAASRFNRGLALRDLGRDEDARDDFQQALDVFEEADAREHAAASARELGTALFALDELDAAVEALERAIELARRGGDRAAIGYAANVLGIVHLRADHPADARAAFDDAAGAHPRSIRPAEHAMARSNLALAAERDGAPHLAALAARQALAIDEADTEVRTQAREVLARCDHGTEPLGPVLATTAEDRWRGVLRAEFQRLADVEGADVDAHAASVVAQIVEDTHAGMDLAEAWFDVLLEQPPATFRRFIAAAIEVLAEHGDREAVKQVLERAMARFQVPQWMRLRDTFNAVAESSGQEATWR